MKLTLLAVAAAVLCTSCATDAQNQRLAAIVDTALIIAQRRGAITAQDAADVRDAKKVIFTPDTTTILIEPAK